MERDDARSLRSIIAQGPLDIDYAIYIIIACCKAVPRTDPRIMISPARILISRETEIALDDAEVFGHLEFGYVAPEVGDGGTTVSWTQISQTHDGQWRQGVVHPNPVEFDRACAAVFALGCVLWEMLVGRQLFKGDTDYQSLQLARAANVPPLSTVPPELEAIVRKALARDPVNRYQTPGHLADALAEFLSVSARN